MDSTSVNIEIENVVLKRNFGLVTGCSFVIGAIIGSGIFVSPQGVLIGAGSYGLSLVIWAICGVISMCTCLAYAEMASIIPKAGSTFNYLKEVYGDCVGFVYLFTSVFCVVPGAHAAIAQTCAEYFMAIFFDDGCPGPPETIRNAMATSIILVCGAINARSSALAGNVSVIFTTAKLSALAVIIFGGLVKLTQGFSDYLSPDKSFEGTSTDAVSITLAFVSAMFAYSGGEIITYAVEELKNPARDIPLIIVISLPLVTTVYILTNISYFTVLSPEEVMSSVAVAVTWARSVMPSVYWFAPLAVSVSTFGTICIGQLLVARLMFAAARENHLPGLLSMLQVETYTPGPSVILLAVLTVCFVYMGTIGELIAFTTTIGWLFNAMVGGAVIILRINGKYSHKQHFKAPLICPIILIVFALFLFLVPLIGDPQWGHLFVMVVLVLAVITWFVFVRKTLSIPGTGAVTTCLQMMLQVVPTQLIEDDISEQEDHKDSLKSDINSVDRLSDSNVNGFQTSTKL